MQYNTILILMNRKSIRFLSLDAVVGIAYSPEMIDGNSSAPRHRGDTACCCRRCIALFSTADLA